MPAFYSVFIPTLVWAIPKFIHSVEQMDPETQKIFIILSILMYPIYALPLGVLGAPALGAYAATFTLSREVLKRILLPLRKKFIHDPGIEAFMRAEYGYQPDRV